MVGFDEIDNKSYIKQSVRNNFVTLGAHRELRLLSDYLHEGEIVLDIVTGSRKNKYGRGLMVATNERLLVLFIGWVFRETHDFSYETVSSIEFKVNGMFFGELTIHGKGSNVTYNWVGRRSGRAFVKVAREIVAKSTMNPRASDNVVRRMTGLEGSAAGLGQHQGSDYSSRISALIEARDKGIISFAEFEAKKNHLLREIAGIPHD